MPVVTFDDLTPDNKSTAPKSGVVTFDDLVPKIDTAAAGQKAVDDMTNNMSFGDKAVAGFGRAFVNLGLGAKQLIDGPAQYLESKFSNGTDARDSAMQTQRAIDQARIDDKALLNTGGGAVGNIAGNIVASIPAAVVAGPSLLGAAVLGGGMAALEPTSGDESRLRNVALGSALGFATQGVVNKGGDYIKSLLAKKAADKLRNAPIDATVRNAVNEGFVIPQSNLNPSFLTNRIEGIAGKTAMEQEASNANSAVFDAMSRRAVGLPEDAALTSQNMQAIRNEAFKTGYEPVTQLGTIPTDAKYVKELSDIVAAQQGAARSFPGAFSDDIMKAIKPLDVPYFDAKDALTASQELRANATKAYMAGDTALGKAQKQASKVIEDQIERHLNSVGPQGGADLLESFRAARQLMAKSHTVEDAIVEGGGSINPAKYAQRLQSGKFMDGDLQTMAEFANNFPKLSRPDNKVRGAGVSKLDGVAGVGIGSLVGSTLGGPAGFAAGVASIAAPLLLRKVLLSKTLQSRAATRNYDPTLMQQFLTRKELEMGAAPTENALREYMNSR